MTTKKKTRTKTKETEGTQKTKATMAYCPEVNIGIAYLVYSLSITFSSMNRGLPKSMHSVGQQKAINCAIFGT